MDTQLLTTFAASLFALLNPLGILPVFISYTAKENKAVQKWLALLLSLTVLGLLLLFLFTGSALLKFFGITLDSFRIAGGILLLLIGINLVTGDLKSTAQDAANQDHQSDFQEAESVYRKIVIPLAMPLLVGPGVIANVILYANEVQAKKGGFQIVELAAVCVFISSILCAILLSGRSLQRILGNVGLSIATRILGLLVASIGVQFIVIGLTHIIVHTIAPQLRL
ncbi:NAAT family transporter [Phormidium sp. LEGE 05292]|uniref:MarC family protein n=1 Tax=[Phormidium] sp. LEGE 05292 TaxID=767427 RepID=UPI00187EED39|nr:MarC family protein [Phormidium sp. LEGE 05292]MBE9224858.1 NAAT family transporter [Phormidium sp. LEGE 05292]